VASRDVAAFSQEAPPLGRRWFSQSSCIERLDCGMSILAEKALGLAHLGVFAIPQVAAKNREHNSRSNESHTQYTQLSFSGAAAQGAAD
jgi:hypothetical protein